jgi:hypothetical protein
MPLTDWFESHVEEFLVLSPTSTSPQPVHVLNGFFHHSLTGRRAPKTAVDLVAMRQGGEWSVGNAQLRQKSPLQLPSDDVKLERGRRAVGALVAADRAVFPTFASFQIAHLGLVTSDSTHHHIGELASRLALADPSGPSALAKVLERLAQPQPNPHWALEAVLSDPDVLDGVAVVKPDDENWWHKAPECAVFGRELSALLARALRLCDVAIDSLLALEVLAVTATWAGLLTYAQVPSLQLGDGLTPLLCQASEPGALPSVRQASAAVIDQIDGRFQRWITSLLEHELSSLFGDAVPTGQDAIDYVIESRPKKKLSGGRYLTEAEVDEIYKAWADDHPATAALAYTLQDSLTSAMGNKARDWFTAVGRHCGFVGPRRGQVPRLRAEVSLVPSLLLSGIDESDPPSLPFDEWAERIAGRIGVVVGPGPVSHTMSPRASEDDLLQNRVDMAMLMTSLGLARRYSDGVTEVLNPFDLWSR